MDNTTFEHQNHPGFTTDAAANAAERPAFQITILESTDEPINKRVELKPDEKLEKQGYRNAYLFKRHLSAPINTIEDLAAELERIQTDPYRCIVMGKPCGPIPLDQPARRLKHAQDDHPATLEDQVVGFLPIDLDGLIIADLDVIGDPEAAVEAAIERLGPEFENVSCWWQLTSGQRPTGNQLRIRLFFILAQPIELAALKHWGEAMAAGDYDHENDCWLRGSVLVDPSIYQCSQPIYVAVPTFTTGRDHLPQRSGLLPREHDTVDLIIPDQASAPNYARGDASGTVKGAEKYLRAIGHHQPGGKGFHTPVGAAVMSMVNEQWPDVNAEGIKSVIREVVRRADRRNYTDAQLANIQSEYYLNASVRGAIRRVEAGLVAKYPDQSIQQIADRIRRYRNSPPRELPPASNYESEPEAQGQQSSNDKSDAMSTAENVIQEALDKAQKDDPGAPFETAVIEALRFLSAQNPAQYMRYRAQFKKACKGILLTELDKMVKAGTDGVGEQESIADAIVALVREKAVLFHDDEDNGYASFEQSGHAETWPLGSRGFTDWLSYCCYIELGCCPGETTLKNAITTLAGIAKHDGEEHKVFLRAANIEDRYYIDLCNDAWEVVEVTPSGWRVLKESPVKFRRTGSMAPLPIPSRNGNHNTLWPFVNISKEDRELVLTWMLDAWRPETPFTILEIGGQQGSGKSDTQERLRQLVDPNRVDLRSAPKTTEDIYVSANNNWVVSFNNLSHLTAAQQDALCTLATGGGAGTRTLYTNLDETIIECKRPVVMNGISTLATAPDLVDRVIKLDLPIIEQRRSDTELRAEFEAQRQVIFGGLLDLFSKTLAKLPEVRIDNPPRMADYTLLGQALMYVVYVGSTYRFEKKYSRAREKAVLLALDASQVAAAVQEYIKDNPQGFSGLVGEFKKRLEQYREEKEGWPRSSRGMGDALRRLAPPLRMVGVEVIFKPRDRTGIPITVKRLLKPDTNDDTFFQDDEGIENQHTQHTRHTRPLEDSIGYGAKKACMLEESTYTESPQRTQHTRDIHTQVVDSTDTDVRDVHCVRHNSIPQKAEKKGFCDEEVV